MRMRARPDSGGHLFHKSPQMRLHVLPETFWETVRALGSWGGKGGVMEGGTRAPWRPWQVGEWPIVTFAPSPDGVLSSNAFACHLSAYSLLKGTVSQPQVFFITIMSQNFFSFTVSTFLKPKKKKSLRTPVNEKSVQCLNLSADADNKVRNLSGT